MDRDHGNCVLILAPAGSDEDRIDIMIVVERVLNKEFIGSLPVSITHIGGPHAHCHATKRDNFPLGAFCLSF